MGILYSERLDFHTPTLMMYVLLHRLRKLRIFRDRVAVGGFLFDLALIDRTLSGQSPRIGNFMVMRFDEIEQMELGCFWKPENRIGRGLRRRDRGNDAATDGSLIEEGVIRSGQGGGGCVRVDVAFHHKTGRMLSGVLRNPLGFVKALERTEIENDLKRVLDVKDIERRLRSDQNVNMALRSSAGKERNPAGKEDEFSEVVAYLKRKGFLSD